MAEEEDRTGGAVVGATTGVVGDAATEFAEGQDQDAVELAMVTQVLDKSMDGVAQFAKETGMGSGLVGMGIIATLGQVVDTGGQTSDDQLGDALQRLSEGGFGVSLPAL